MFLSLSLWERVRVRDGWGYRLRPLTPALSRWGLCTISRFWTLLLDLHRYKLINSMLNFEFLCKAPGGRGSKTSRLVSCRQKPYPCEWGVREYHIDSHKSLF